MSNSEEVNSIRIGNIENYYGYLLVKKEEGHCYFGIQDYASTFWERIPRTLYDSLIKFNNNLT